MILVLYYKNQVLGYLVAGLPAFLSLRQRSSYPSLLPRWHFLVLQLRQVAFFLLGPLQVRPFQLLSFSLPLAMEFAVPDIDSTITLRSLASLIECSTA